MHFFCPAFRITDLCGNCEMLWASRDKFLIDTRIWWMCFIVNIMNQSILLTFACACLLKGNESREAFQALLIAWNKMI